MPLKTYHVMSPAIFTGHETGGDETTFFTGKAFVHSIYMGGLLGGAVIFSDVDDNVIFKGVGGRFTVGSNMTFILRIPFIAENGLKYKGSSVFNSSFIVYTLEGP